MGASLAGSLNTAIDRIDESESDPRARGDVIAQMADAAGISSGTVNQILNAEIDCPPRDRLRGFAEVNGIPSFNTIIAAARSDGCQGE